MRRLQSAQKVTLLLHQIKVVPSTRGPEHQIKVVPATQGPEHQIKVALVTQSSKQQIKVVQVTQGPEKFSRDKQSKLRGALVTLIVTP